MDRYKNRISRILEQMQLKNIDIMLIPPSEDMYYLTGRKTIATERVVMLVLSKTQTYFVVPSFESHQFQEKFDSIQILGWEETQNPLEIISNILNKHGKNISVIPSMCSGWLMALQQNLQDKNWFNAGSIMSFLRRRKDEFEISMLKKAQQMAEQAFKLLLPIGFVGRTEMEIARQLNRIREKVGFDSFGIPLIASGPNTAFPHHRTGERKIQKNDIVMLDFGGCYAGYHADMTRTVVTGEIPEGFHNIYNTVLKAHMAAEATAKPGVLCSYVDKAGRDIIREAGFGSNFTHRLGHGIGLRTHEEPFISEDRHLALEVGNVFTNEPGIYIPGNFGVRIENMLCITQEGCSSFNTLSRELMTIE